MKVGYNNARLILSTLERDGFIYRFDTRSPYNVSITAESINRYKCKTLKTYRENLAKINHIKFKTTECDFEGECPGFCPACDEEILYLEKELRKKEERGEKIKLDGLLEIAFKNKSTVNDNTSTQKNEMSDKVVEQKSKEETNSIDTVEINESNFVYYINNPNDEISKKIREKTLKEMTLMGIMPSFIPLKDRLKQIKKKQAQKKKTKKDDK